MAWIAFAVGIWLLLLTGISVIKTLLIPRNLSSAISGFAGQLVLATARAITCRIRSLHRREDILAAAAPSYLFTVLAFWIALLYLAYAMILLPFTPGSSIPLAFKMSGSSLFTLGFATPAGAAPYGIVFAAAISGLAVIALMIGYMPTIYSAYNRRETLVIMLESLSGKPPWGPELLARQQLIGNTATLPALYARWTEWAADVSESHTTYRTLIYFRSRWPQQAWPLALLSVLDAAALQLALTPDSAPAEARPLLRIGYICLRQIAHTIGVPVNDDPHPDDPLALTREEFDEAIKHLDEAGWIFERKPDEAWPHFKGWRVNYELAAYGIAAHLDLAPAVWSGPRTRLGQTAARPERPPHREPAPAPKEPALAPREPTQVTGDPSVRLWACGST